MSALKYDNCRVLFLLLRAEQLPALFPLEDFYADSFTDAANGTICISKYAIFRCLGIELKHENLRFVDTVISFIWAGIDDRRSASRKGECSTYDRISGKCLQIRPDRKRTL